MGDPLQPRRRQPHQRRADPTLTRTFSCPRCGQAGHSAQECAGAGSVTALTSVELENLRRLVSIELGHAMIAGAPHRDIDAMLDVLTAIEVRRSRDDGVPLPRLPRRQQHTAATVLAAGDGRVGGRGETKVGEPRSRDG